MNSDRSGRYSKRLGIAASWSLNAMRKPGGVNSGNNFSKAVKIQGHRPLSSRVSTSGAAVCSGGAAGVVSASTSRAMTMAAVVDSEAEETTTVAAIRTPAKRRMGLGEPRLGGPVQQSPSLLNEGFRH